MARKEFTYHGKKLEELKEMDTKAFAQLLPARQRRSLTRGFSEMQKRLLLKVKKARAGTWTKPIRTHCRDMVIVPEMVGLTIHIHAGRAFVPIQIISEMVGRYLGEMTMTRQKTVHSAPGIGATKSSAAASVK